MVPQNRYAFAFFILLSLALMIAGKSNPIMIESARERAVDALAPVMDVVARPMVLAERVANMGRDIVALRTENQRLRREQCATYGVAEFGCRVTK